MRFAGFLGAIRKSLYQKKNETIRTNTLYFKEMKLTDVILNIVVRFTSLFHSVC